MRTQQVSSQSAMGRALTASRRKGAPEAASQVSCLISPCRLFEDRIIHDPPRRRNRPHPFRDETDSAAIQVAGAKLSATETIAREFLREAGPREDKAMRILQVSLFTLSLSLSGCHATMNGGVLGGALGGGVGSALGGPWGGALGGGLGAAIGQRHHGYGGHHHDHHYYERRHHRHHHDDYDDGEYDD